MRALEPAEGPGEGSDGTYVLRLFVAGHEHKSRLARENLQRICDEYLKDRHRIEVIDVFENFQAALEHNIFLTPALVRVLPGPPTVIFGSLNDSRQVAAALRLEGLHERM